MGHHGTEKDDVLRLSRALQSGTGHVAVIAEDRATARAQARGALVRVEAAAVVHVSAAGVEAAGTPAEPGSDPKSPRARVRSLMAPLLEQARAVEKPAFIIVDDADAADGAELERIRISVECAPDAIKWLRIVLVGGEGLERSLNDPAASALASRLCARVRLAPEPRIPPPARVSAPVRLAALAAFAVAFASLGAWSYLLRLSPARVPAVAVSDAEPVVVARAEHAQAGAAETDTGQREPARSDAAETSKAPAVALAGDDPGTTEPTHAADTSAASVLEKTATAEPARGAASASDQLRSAWHDASVEAAASAESTPPSEPAAAEHAGQTAPAAKPAAVDAKLARVDAKAATVVRAAQPRHAASNPAPKPSAPPAPLARGAKVTVEPEVTPLSREVVLQVGPFEDAKRAYALRNELRSSVDHVLVARLDSADGAPLYGVRVVGLESRRDVAQAEEAIHALGHESVRYEKPGPLERLGRNWRPFLASLFGH